MQATTTFSLMRPVKYYAGKTLLHIVLIVGALFTSVPVYYMISTSFKAEREVFAIPIHWFPADFQWLDNYRKAFEIIPFGRFFLNSVIVTVSVVLITIVSSAIAGYGLAKYKFPGNNLCFMIILSTMMVPIQVILIPLYSLVDKLGWTNTYAGLIIPASMNAFGVYLMRQFCLTIPDELLDSGRIDGASELGIFLRLILPLTKPALATLGIIIFKWSWNSLYWPMIVATRTEIMTLTVGMTLFDQPLREPYWTYIMAVSTVATLPTIALFVSMQKYFIQGVVVSGLKG
ncbi:MAG: carbohydrate ABC transporter permease [Chloroflexi bacterium]|nr:carbohydrate ABC transporter permease [Chloroflexota bacterium]